MWCLLGFIYFSLCFGLPIDQIPVKEFNQNHTVVSSDIMLRAEHEISGEDFQKKLEKTLKEKLKGRSSLEIRQEFEVYLRNQIQEHGQGFYNLRPGSAWIGSWEDSAEKLLDYESKKAIQVVGYYYPGSFKSHWGLRVGSMVYQAGRCHKNSDTMCTSSVDLESFAKDYIGSPGGKRSNLWADHQIGHRDSETPIQDGRISRYVTAYANYNTGLVGRYSSSSNNGHHFVQNLCSHIDTLHGMKCDINSLPYGFGLSWTKHQAFWCRGTTCGCYYGSCWAYTTKPFWCKTNKAQTKKKAGCSSNKDCSNGWECH